MNKKIIKLEFSSKNIKGGALKYERSPVAQSDAFINIADHIQIDCFWM
jgi:hypothetical protein